MSTTASWAFDEAGGSTAGDASGNAHALTLTGGASFTAGHAGNALTLNGTNGYAQSPSVIDTQGSFTASAWVKFDSVSGWRTIMNQSGTGQSKFWLQKRDSTGKFSFVLATDDAAGSPQVRVDSKLTPVAGTWYHVAGVCNAAESTISLYVNGSLEGTEKYDAVWAANGPTLIGAAYTPSGTTHRTDFFPGQIDDARTDDVALSADQIATIAGRRGVWTMNEAPSTTTAADTSGAGNNLTLYSNAAFAPGRTGNALTLNVPYSHARPGGSVIDTTRSFTIDAWVKLNGTGTGGTGPTPLSGWQTVVSQAGTNRNKFWLQKRGDSGKFSLLFAESDVAQTNVIHVDSAVVPQANQWYHVAGMYDAAAESIKLYVDGVLQGTLPYTATWAATGDTRVGSGVVPGSPLTGNDFFKGQIDDLNVTNNTLTANQIRVRAGLAPLAAPAPTGVKVVARGGTGAKVTWTSAAEDATGYVVETSTDNGSTWTQSATAGATQRTAAIKDLPVSTAVKTRVRATNAAGNSAPSATATATTGAVDESGIYVIADLGYGFLLSHGIADFTASGSLRFKDPLVHATQATDWRAAAEALLVGDAYVNGTHYAFPGDRFTVATGAQIGLGSGEGSLFQNHLTTATQQAIGFEDGVDGDFNDDFWAINVERFTVDLDVDSNYDGTIDDSDDASEETAGGIVFANADDDNNNSEIDRYEPGTVASEDDLVPVLIHSPTPDPLFSRASLVLELASGSVNVWSSPQHGTLLLGSTNPLGAPVTSVSLSPGEQYVYVEGITSAAMRDVTLQLKYEEDFFIFADDTIKLTVIDPEMDAVLVNHVASSDTLFQSLETSEGAFLPVNNDDDDYSATAADGGADKDQNGAIAGETDLLPVKLRKMGPAALGGEYKLDIPSHLKVWRNADRSDEITSTTAIDAKVDTTVYVEGITKAAGELKLNWSNGTHAKAASDVIKITAFEWSGPLNVPGYSIYNYKAAGALADSKWLTPGDGTIKTGAGTSDVTILWGEGAVVGKAIYEVNDKYTWDLEVNVVRVKIGTKNSLAYKTHPGQFGGTTLITSDIDRPAMEAELEIEIDGPLIGVGMRGVQFIQAGFTQTLAVTKWHADYDTLPKAAGGGALGRRRTTNMEGNQYLDGITDAPGTTVPWYDSNDQGPAGADGLLDELKNEHKTGTLKTGDTPELAGTDVWSFKEGGVADDADLFSMIVDYEIALVVRTKATPNDADMVFTKRASAAWQFDGSGSIAAQVWTKTGKGTTGAASFAAVTDGTPLTSNRTLANTFADASLAWSMSDQ